MWGVSCRLKSPYVISKRSTKLTQDIITLTLVVFIRPFREALRRNILTEDGTETRSHSSCSVSVGALDHVKGFPSYFGLRNIILPVK